MSSAKKQVRKLLTEADSTPYGPQELELVKQAVQVAQAAGDESLEFMTRKQLNVSAVMAGDTDTLLSSFAWCLAKHDERPDEFALDLNGTYDLLWQYKWIGSKLSSSPIFPTEQLAAVLDDMEARYQRAGLGPSGVLRARFSAAWANGHLDEAERLRQELARTPRDSHSHCEACVSSADVEFLAQAGRDEESIAALEAMMAGAYTCGDEPEHALAQGLVPYLRLGKFAEAKAAHLRSYRASQNDQDKVRIIVRHLVFLAITGNEPLALGMLERHLPWITHDGLDQAAQFETLLATAFVCDAVARAGHPDVLVRGAEEAALVPLLGEAREQWSVTTLAPVARRGAASIGDRFDARNGNDYFAQLARAFDAVAQEHYDLPLAAPVFAPVAVTPQDSAPDDGAGWLLRSREHMVLGDSERSIEAATRALESLEGEEAAQAWGVIVSGHSARQDWVAANDAMSQQILALRAAGMEAKARSVERVGAAISRDGQNADPLLLEAERVRQEADGAPADVVADLAVTLAVGAMHRGELDGVLDVLDHALAAFAGPHRQHSREVTGVYRFQYLLMTGDADAAIDYGLELRASFHNRALQASIGKTIAHTYAARGQFQEGAHLADESVKILMDFASSGLASHAANLAGQMYLDADDPTQAVARFRFAIDHTQSEGPTPPALLFNLGRALVQAGEPEDALDTFLAALGTLPDLPGQEDDEQRLLRASLLRWSGRALVLIDELDEAMEAWSEAVEAFEAIGAAAEAARMRMEKAEMFGASGEVDRAVDELEAALTLARSQSEEPKVTYDAAWELAEVYAGRDDPRAVTAIDEAVAIGHEHSATELVAAALDLRARILLRLGRGDEALASGTQAAQGYLEIGELAPAGASEAFVGQALLSMDRAADAVPFLRAARERPECYAGFHREVSLILADALDATGDALGAAEVRDAIGS